MPSDSQSQGGRSRHFHRGRRGHDRRAGDRRGPPPQQAQQHSPEQAPRGDHVDVEQIMRDIRSKIAQRHGVELTEQQVHELAARRLESILDIRNIKPSLLDQLRKSAGARPDTVAAADRAAVPYTFEDTTLYESPSGFTRFIRKLLNPILKLFFNPNPLIKALHIQSQLNVEAARREAERDQRQAEWNALHYEILQRLVSEVAKVSLEVQGLSLRVESLSTKVDFNERRVRSIEGTVQQPRPSVERRDRDRERERERDREPMPGGAPPAPVAAQPETPVVPRENVPSEQPTGEAPRRRRRRRRGRRGGGGEMTVPAAAAEVVGGVESLEGEDSEEGDNDVLEPDPIVSTGVEEVIHDEAAPAHVSAPMEEIAPERVTPQLAQPDPEAREEAAPEVPAPVASAPEVAAPETTTSDVPAHDAPAHEAPTVDAPAAVDTPQRPAHTESDPREPQ